MGELKVAYKDALFPLASRHLCVNGCYGQMIQTIAEMIDY